MIEGLENICKADSARSTKIDCTKTIEEYIQAQDWRIKANANTGYSNAGLINNISGKIIANYWLDKVYSKAGMLVTTRTGIIDPVNDRISFYSFCKNLFDYLEEY